MKREVLMPANNHWSEERWDSLCKQLCADFGPEAASKIIKTIIYTIGGERITLPSIQDLQKRERDRQICLLDRGDNHPELAERFQTSVRTVERAILKQRILDRQKQNGTGKK